MTYKEIKIQLGTRTWEKFIRCVYAVANHTALEEIDQRDAIFAAAKAVYCCGGMTDNQYQSIVDVLRNMAVEMDSAEMQELFDVSMELQDTLDPTYR